MRQFVPEFTRLNVVNRRILLRGGPARFDTLTVVEAWAVANVLQVDERIAVERLAIGVDEVSEVIPCS